MIYNVNRARLQRALWLLSVGNDARGIYARGVVGAVRAAAQQAPAGSRVKLTMLWRCGQARV